MPRVNVVTNSRKAHKCDRCGKTVKAGKPYRWAKGRYGPKKVRCMEYACRFRASDLSSAHSAVVDDAVEDANAAIDAASTPDEIKDALQQAADAAREASEAYDEANNNWTQNGASDNEEWTEKRDAYESFADDLESFDFSGETEAEEGEDEDDVIEGLRQEARNALDEAPSL